jgi:autotransporter-associated beta strand protein
MAGLLSAFSAAAASDTWTGGAAPDGNWTTANNWGGVAPVANDFLFFDGSSQPITTNDFAAGTAFGNITFNGGADLFVLNGNALVLTNGVDIGRGSAFGGGITNTSPNSETVNLPVTLSAGNHFITTLGGGQLNLTNLSRNKGGIVQFNTSSGSINLTGSGLANANGILGGWALIGVGANAGDWASLDANSNVVAYTGYTVLPSGGATTNIANGPANNVKLSASGGTAYLAAGTTVINTLLYAPDGNLGNGTIALGIGTNLTLGAQGAIINLVGSTPSAGRQFNIGTTAGRGVLTAGGGVANAPGEISLYNNGFNAGTGNNLNINSIIADNGSGVVSVNIMGYVAFPNVTNTYSGGTYISQGRVQAGCTNNFGKGPVFVYPGGEIFLNQNGVWTNEFYLYGVGSTESAGIGAIRMGGTGRVISGKVTLLGTTATGNGTIVGRITGPGGLIVGSGSANGSGTLVIGGTNDYAGDTTINSDNASGANILQVSTTSLANIMPHGVGRGNLVLNASNATIIATFDLNNTVETINGLVSSARSPANNFVTSGTGGVLIVGDNDATATFAGKLLGRLALTKIGTGTQTLSGVNTNTGDLTVNGGTLLIASGGSISGSTNITVNTNATLDVAAICPLTLGVNRNLTASNGTLVVALQGIGNAITTPTLTANGTTNYVTIKTIPAVSGYPAQFTVIKYTALGGTLNFGLAGALPASPGAAYAGYISNNVANNSVDFVVTAGPVSIKWAGHDGTSINSAWDTTTTDWRLGGGGLTAYSDGVFANFDDSASNSLVSINQDVSPAGITVSNNVLTYTNIGGSKITGSGGLTKQGPGRLILDNSGANDFTGGISISAGTLQIGDNDSGGALPNPGNIVDNGALVFARNDTYTDSSTISGTGTITKNNTNGILTLSGVNSFTGAVTVAQGTLVIGNNSALGTTNGGTTVSSGATLDVGANAINLGQEVITVSGVGVNTNGALINSSGSTTFVGPNIGRLVLAGDTRVGGSGRFDVRSATTANSLLASLSTLGQPRKLTVAMTGPTIAFGLIGITVDPALGDIEVQSGIFSIEAATTSLGNTASNLVVWPGATFQMFAATNQINKVFTLGGDGTVNTVSATSGSSTVIGPMNITNDCIFSVNNATVTLNLNNVISGPGKITKVGLGLLNLAGNSPAYGGGLQLNQGSVTVSGTLSNSLGVTVSLGKFTLNGTLLGAGGVTNTSAASSVVGSGTNFGPMDITGALNPGDTNVIGTLTTSNLTLQSGATLNFDLASANTPGGGINDLINVNGDLVVNGNGITINPLALLQRGAGNPYRLFNYTGNLIWNADLSVSAPGAYTFTVDTNTLGQVNLIVSNGPPVWNGGSPTVNNWTDSANWSGVTINPSDTLFFDGVTRLNNTNDTPADTTYTDLAFNNSAGAFVLNGNPVTLAGNVINTSTNVQTLKLGLSYSASRTFSGGTGGLIIGAGVTNAANLITLTLSGNGTMTNLLASADPNTMTNIISVISNANWSLMDNPASTPITTPVQLDILAGTFTFGSATSAPNLTNTAVNNISRVGVTPGTPATFNMVNGKLTIASRLNTGAAAQAVAIINQSGGTLNPQSLLQVSDSSANAFTAINVTGGTLYVGDATGPNNIFLASRGTGVVSVATGGFIRGATLDLSRNAAGNTLGSVGVFNLNTIGTLSVTRIGAATGAAQAGGTPTANFNFNGGTLLAGASSTTFIQGNASAPTIPIISTVKSGGAIIDTTNFNISILEPLIHDATLGATPDGGLTKKGSGTLTLPTANTYTGSTVVSNGTLLISGSLGLTAVTVATNGTLAGTGSVGSNVTVQAGGTISPAVTGTIGTFTVANNVVLQGTNAVDINQSTATNDVLKAGGSITYGGTLAVNNLAGTLTAADTFKLFSAASYAGTFSSVTPTIPASGLAWNTNTLTTDGILRLVATVNQNPTNIIAIVNGSNLELSWPADHTGWHLQAQTNSLANGLGTNWVTIPNTDVSNSYTNTFNPANGTVFYRMVYP